MSWCSAVGCSNCRRNCKNTGVSFHRIPKDEKLKRQWETKLKRQILPKNINVCSEHFTEECFDVSSKLQLEMLGTKKRRMPTLFMHKEEKRRTLLWRTWIPKNNKPGEKIINFLFSLFSGRTTLKTSKWLLLKTKKLPYFYVKDDARLLKFTNQWSRRS